MKLILPERISEIDRYCEDVLGISTLSLMDKSGEAVARLVRDRHAKGETVIVLAGDGNNGGDGYAAAWKLAEDYKITVLDVFGKGPKGKESQHFRSLAEAAGCEIRPLVFDEKTVYALKHAGLVIDAIFGTGFHGDLPKELKELSRILEEAIGVSKLAIDVPLGVSAADGSVSEDIINVDATVTLSFIKAGLVSYPARSYVGEIVHDDLGLPTEHLLTAFPPRHHLIDRAFAEANLPHRESNSNKGSFGKLLVITGSEHYRGAAALSLEGALRGGVGYVSYLGIPSLTEQLSSRFPEAIYQEKPKDEELTEEDVQKIVAMSARHTATLIGCGSDNTEGLYRLVSALLASEGGTLILDADAINALSCKPNLTKEALKTAKRRVILTPHPLEFARLIGADVASVQLSRMRYAEQLAADTGAVVVLKGAGTIVTDGDVTYINSTGSSALAKAGSGDVLAGFLSSLVAMGGDALTAAALSVYFHGLAADTLAKVYSSYGVTPSDLPKQIAMEISRIEMAREDDHEA